MINLCGECIHGDSCFGSNDDYSEDGGLCVHYRRKRGATVTQLQSAADNSNVQVPAAGGDDHDA